jgi:uncharacterized integral membrane protein
MPKPADSAEASAHTALLPTEPNSKIGKTWVFLSIFAVLALLLLIFIAQNSTSVRIHYLGFSGTIGFGVAMLLAAVTGCILTLLVGSARIIQLKVARKKYLDSATS